MDKLNKKPEPNRMFSVYKNSSYMGTICTCIEPTSSWYQRVRDTHEKGRREYEGTEPNSDDEDIEAAILMWHSNETKKFTEKFPFVRREVDTNLPRNPE